ncbi:MAG: hypothetical protein NTZ41_10035 [Sphingobacteriales bacterium]|nr:hypothetical protein [Sphingobacteriales bacterium]
MALIFAIFAVALTVYYLTKEYKDTRNVKPDYTLTANELFQAFQKNDSSANKNYTEKILEINGIISAVEKADTVYNLKMTDSATGSFINFALQWDENLKESDIHAGDKVTVRGSCSGAIYSEILETRAINFKRCILIK